jgi:hypothetical protein
MEERGVENKHEGGVGRKNVKVMTSNFDSNALDF